MGNFRVIYEHKEPPFAIMVDDLQWAIGVRIKNKQNKSGYAYTPRSYHPKITLLLDELAEWLLRRHVQPMTDFSKMHDEIIKIYKLTSTMLIPKHTQSHLKRRGGALQPKVVPTQHRSLKGRKNGL